MAMESKKYTADVVYVRTRYNILVVNFKGEGCAFPQLYKVWVGVGYLGWLKQICLMGNILTILLPHCKGANFPRVG